MESHRKDLNQRVTEPNPRTDRRNPEITAFDKAPLGMLIVHRLTGKIVKGNAAACAFFGYQAEELTAQRFASLCCPSEREHGAGLIDPDLSTQERRFIHRRGHVIWGQTSLASMASHDGSEDLMVIQIQDVAELNAAHDQLSSLDNAFEIAFEANPLPSAIVDSCGRITGMNPRMRTVLSQGYKQSNEIALATLVKCGDDAAAKFAEFFAGKSTRIEIDVLLFNGQPSERMTSISLTRVGAGHSPTVYAVLHLDISLGVLNSPEQYDDPQSNVVPLERRA